MKPLVRGTSLLAAFVLVIAVAGRTLAGAPVSGRVDASGTDANVTRLTADILARSQFAHHPLDAELAARFLDRYLDALDGTRSLFLQSDVDEFARYRATLAQATLAAGDTSAARAIFARYLERLEAADRVRHGLATYDALLLHGARRLLVRSASTRSARANLAAAQQLWRQQLRAEYLQEKLADKRPDQIVSTLTRRHAQQLRDDEGHAR